MRQMLACAAILFMASSLEGHACSITTPCIVDERNYYVALPKPANLPAPAVVYIHGWGGNGQAALRNKDLITVFLERGFAVIAPDGVPREGRSGRSWGFHPQSGRQLDEIDFLRSVKEDAIARFNLDSTRMILAGFSIGGSMTAYTACLAPKAFAGYAPLGGNFWRPHPTQCEGPVHMLHTHGWSDGTVPLEGRVVNGVPMDDPSAFAQGDIFHTMSIWRATNNCTQMKADKFSMNGPFWRRSWNHCDTGSSLELAIYPGGHSIPKTWPSLVVDWFEALHSD
ncbi:dienelactone hydrolase family protein [Shimia sp. R10_1]|uniref:alpha/beta hydrolase family esterase n=1 Tax=Shimia sp. R10_1 TaxID=2821095 RepID=UPI001AD95828|nr:PHB depolymerase family esterase [Shimia sp. R10_1]MBO9475832.1 dienelactone hydrolase family protein [Shimia sp. R10_1]